MSLDISQVQREVADLLCADISRRWKLPASAKSFFGVLVILLGCIPFTAPLLLSTIYTALGNHKLTQIIVDAGALGEAITYFEQAQRIQPDNADVYRRLSVAYRQAGHYAEALAAQEQAYRLNPASLLVQQELASAYDLVGKSAEAETLWQHLDMPRERIIQLGDTYLAAGDYATAWVWYKRLLNMGLDLESEQLYRAAIAAVIVKAPEANALINQLGRSEERFQGLVQTGAVLSVDGALLRWLSPPSVNVPIGANLTFGAGATASGYMWGNGQAVLIIEVLDSGSYEVQIQVVHSAPPPILLAVGVDGQRNAQRALSRGDETTENVSLSVPLAAGLHTVHVWFLNDGYVDGVDRNAVINMVTLRRQ